MASERQVAANRANCLRSTGPRTEEGKARASCNALRHGLLSRQVLMAGEDGAELAEVREAIVGELAPASPLEWLLAEQVVAAAWRLRRAMAIERGMMEYNLATTTIRNNGYGSQPHNFGSMVGAHMGWASGYNGLTRYIAQIERSMYKALAELKALRAGEITKRSQFEQQATGNGQEAIGTAEVRAAPDPGDGENAERSQFEAQGAVGAEVASGSIPSIPSISQGAEEAEVAEAGGEMSLADQVRALGIPVSGTGVMAEVRAAGKILDLTIGSPAGQGLVAGRRMVGKRKRK